MIGRGAGVNLYKLKGGHALPLTLHYHLLDEWFAEVCLPINYPRVISAGSKIKPIDRPVRTHWCCSVLPDSWGHAKKT